MTVDEWPSLPRNLCDTKSASGSTECARDKYPPLRRCYRGRTATPQAFAARNRRVTDSGLLRDLLRSLLIEGAAKIAIPARVPLRMHFAICPYGYRGELSNRHRRDTRYAYDNPCRC